MYNYASSPPLDSCTFSGNSALRGGGIGNVTGSSPTVSNCIFYGNMATGEGGGVSNFKSSSPTLVNCTLNNNSAPSGGGMRNVDFSNAIVRNCILWGDTGEISNTGSTPTVTYSCVQGDYAGLGNINQDPLFVDAAGGDYHLKSEAGHWTAGGWVIDGVTSLCIDAGDPADDYSNEPEDNDDRVNMGAYGNTAQAAKSFAAAAPGADGEAMEDSEEWVVPPATVAEPIPEVF